MENKIAAKDNIEVFVLEGGSDVIISRKEIASKLAGISAVSKTKDKVAMAANVLVGTTSYFIPLGANINVDEQLKKMNEELEYNKGFLNSVKKKLANASFVNNAPAQVVENEKKKQADAETKIRMLEEQINQLKK